MSMSVLTTNVRQVCVCEKERAQTSYYMLIGGQIGDIYIGDAQKTPNKQKKTINIQYSIFSTVQKVEKAERVCVGEGWFERGLIFLDFAQH